MSNWHKESLNDKINLIKQEWKNLNIWNAELSVNPSEGSNDIVASDGHIEVIVKNCIQAQYQILDYRAIHQDHRNYVRHVLRTMVIALSKKHFNVPKE